MKSIRTKGFPHGLCTTHVDVINGDLLEFFRI